MTMGPIYGDFFSGTHHVLLNHTKQSNFCRRSGHFGSQIDTTSSWQHVDNVTTKSVLVSRDPFSTNSGKSELDFRPTIYDVVHLLNPTPHFSLHISYPNPSPNCPKMTTLIDTPPQGAPRQNFWVGHIYGPQPTHSITSFLTVRRKVSQDSQTYQQ